MGEVKAEIVRCHYCKTLGVTMGGYGQCVKGCPGRFEDVQYARIPIEGVRQALAEAESEELEKP